MSDNVALFPKIGGPCSVLGVEIISCQLREEFGAELPVQLNESCLGRESASPHERG